MWINENILSPLVFKIIKTSLTIYTDLTIKQFN